MISSHRAKTLLHFEEAAEEIFWKGRQLPFSAWEDTAERFGFKADNYYTPSGKMFAECLKAQHDGRLCGTFRGIVDLIEKRR